MDLVDKLRELASRLPRQLDHIQTEEATKSALVMPFIAALGYNVFDPTEVTPELNADIGVKKGEKVDYAILKDGKPIMLFECKHHASDLAHAHASQLYRYFSVTEVRFSVLTNGILYWFYTDMDAPNKMDAKPFFEFNLYDLRDDHVSELKKFSKSAFDLNSILTTANELKYTREIARLLSEQMREPSDEFLKLVVSHVYSGRMTQPIREQFGQFVRQAFAQIVNDRITERLKTALAGEDSKVSVPPVQVPDTAATPTSNETSGTVVTTDDEIESYYIIRAILREVVNVKRVVMRDVQSYCGILLDDSNRKTLCRLYFNTTQKYIGFLEDGQLERVPIDSLDDIYKHVDRLHAVVARIETKTPTPKGKATPHEEKDATA
jgi:predicted type IV restriction endonuclease